MGTEVRRGPLYSQYRAWAETYLKPTVASRDGRKDFDEQLFCQLADTGFFKLLAPRQFGGSGATVADYLDAFAGLARGAMDIPFLLSVGVQGVAITLLEKFGTDGQKRANYPGMLAGTKISALCNSEVAAGTDIKNIKSFYKMQGDDRGIATIRKSSANNLSVADVAFVSAWHLRPAGDPVLEILMLQTPRGKAQKPLELSGFWTGATGSLELTDFEFSKRDSQLGRDGTGFDVLKCCFNLERFLIPVIIAHTLEGMLEEAVEQTRTRKAFGKSIGSFQYNQDKIVELYSTKQILLALIDQLVLAEPGRFPGDDSALSHIKMFAVEKGFAAATLFCELFGTLGYGAHHPSQKLLRDLLGLKFLGGTKEQHKMTIFMTLFGALAQNEQKSAKAA